LKSYITAAFVACAAVVSSADAIRADVVTKWNAAALDAIRADSTPPPRAARALAILHVSMYDAINGIVRTHEPYVVSGAVRASASIEAAASASAHVALTQLFPAQEASFDAVHRAMLARIKDGPHQRAGSEWGERVAREILAWRSNDNADAVVALPSGEGPGVWQPTPPASAPYLLPQWGFVTPFAIPAGSFMRPPGPPALDSARWAADYNEVKSLGAAVGSSRTPEQSLIAQFWADGAGTETPPGHWNRIAQQASASRRSSLTDKARLFALLNMAMADAAICAWDAKYIFNFWRHVTAIRGGDSVGNPATIADPSWSSFIGTPPFPDYVSGHSTFSGAAAAVLAMFYGTDRIRFVVGSKQQTAGCTVAFTFDRPTRMAWLPELPWASGRSHTIYGTRSAHARRVICRA
jgi:hypothetical protein